MIVYRVDDMAADHLAHSLDDVLATRVGVLPGQLHRGQIANADLTVFINNARRHVDAILAARFLKVLGRARVAETARTEVDADPYMAEIAAHEINIVIATADRAELRLSFLPVVFAVGSLPQFSIVKQGVLNFLVVHAPNTE